MVMIVLRSYLTTSESKMKKTERTVADHFTKCNIVDAKVLNKNTHTMLHMNLLKI